MIYLDNAATGGFKSSAVKDAVFSAVNYLCANPGRSGHYLSLTAEEFVFKTRTALNRLFNGYGTSKTIFTKNCTEALNLAILGTVKKGDHVVTTVTEHNSVLRPLIKLKKLGIVDFSVAHPSNGKYIIAEDVKPFITPKTSLVAINGASNVTGALNDVQGIAKLCKEYGVPILVDGAQTAGHVNTDLKNWGIDLFAVAGHKGLGGIMGIGALMFSDKVSPEPLLTGGSGTETFSDEPCCYPEKLESGTLNLPGICSLYEGVCLVEEKLKQTEKNLISTSKYLIDLLSSINGVKVYSEANPCGIVSFEVKEKESVAVAEILSSKYDIAVRGGFHCAPLMHKFLKTDEKGLVRASISSFNSRQELLKLYYAVKEIAQN